MTLTPKSTRLPRFRRAEAELCLTDRDITILALVMSFRLVTSEHIQVLAEGSPQNVLRRLQKLFHSGYLDRLAPQRIPGGGSARMVYAITNKGVSILQKEGFIEGIAKTDRNAQNRDLGEPFIRHRLLVSHVRTLLTAACSQRRDIALHLWREGPTIRDRSEVTLTSGYAEIPVAADGFFRLRDAQGRSAYFFLEADCGSMQLKRFTLKLRGYAAYSSAKKHTEKFGIPHFRVLTVTTSRVRCRNLVEAAWAEEGLRKDARLFLFAGEEDLPLARPESVFVKIWTVPGMTELCSILPTEARQSPKEGGFSPAPGNAYPVAHQQTPHDAL